MLLYAIITLVIVYIAFDELCYFTWGSDMNEPIITQMLPADSVTVILIKFMYSLNLLCSYAIFIYPANIVFEQWLCKCFAKDRTRLYWAQNFSRFVVTLLAAVLGVTLASKIDKFLGLIGSFLCAPLAMTFPAVLHLKHSAKTGGDKALGLFILGISICIFFFCSIQTLLAW